MTPLADPLPIVGEVVTRGARITGALLCALLALIAAGWVVRDIAAVDETADLVRYWAGHPDVRLSAVPTTSANDLALLVVYLVTAFAALRSAVAATALVATGAVTLAMRLPGLRNIVDPAMNAHFADDLRTRALICTFAALAAGIALLVTAGAGRRPPRDSSESTPTRPGPGAGVTTFLLLGASGALVIAWDIRQVVRYPAMFPEWYVGAGPFFQALIDPPPGWGDMVIALLCLYAAASALFRAVHTRPFGLIAAALLLTGGAAAVSRAVHDKMLSHFGDLPAEGRLMVLNWIFEAIAGAVMLIVLARRGTAEAPPRPHQGHGQGYGHPQPGVFGPPPPSQPPPGW